MRYLQKGAQNTPFSGLPCLFLCIYRRPPPYPHFYIFRVWPFNGLERVSYIEKYFVKKILLFKSLVICFFVTLAMHRMINLNAQRHIIYIGLKFISEGYYFINEIWLISHLFIYPCYIFIKNNTAWCDGGIVYLGEGGVIPPRLPGLSAELLPDILTGEGSPSISFPLLLLLPGREELSQPLQVATRT